MSSSSPHNNNRDEPHDSDSDAPPQELTSHQGLEIHKELKKAQQLSQARVRRELKERRKKWAERLTPRPKSQAKASDGENEMVEDDLGQETRKQTQVISGMLPNDIVNLLAAREKQVFESDSEEERMVRKPKTKKKKTNTPGVETVILKELPPAPCVQTSLEFLKKRKTRVPRSAAILNNSNQALRLLSSSGLLK